VLSLNSYLFGKSLSSLQFQHHKNKLFFGRNGKIIRRRFYIRLLDKPVATGCPDNDLANILIALNCDCFPLVKTRKGLLPDLSAGDNLLLGRLGPGPLRSQQSM
jgi:hypothetical protein